MNYSHLNANFYLTILPANLGAPFPVRFANKFVSGVSNFILPPAFISVSDDNICHRVRAASASV